MPLLFFLALASSASFVSTAFPFCLPGGSASTNRLGFDNTIARCAEIASPSRSGSGARYTASAVCAAFLRSWMTLPLPEIICRVGSKIFSSLMLILGVFASTLALFFAPFFFFDFFLPAGSSPGKRIPMVFVGRSITCPMDALTV